VETDQTTASDEELQKATKSIALRGDDERLRPESQFQTTIGRTVLTMTGAVRLDLNPQKNLDLDSTRDNDRIRLTPELKANFIFSFPHDILLFTQLGLEDKVTLRDKVKPMNVYSILFDEFFVHVPLPLSVPSAFRIGRQQFFEPRRWFLNDDLDGIRLFLDPHPFHVNLSVSTPVPSFDTSIRAFDDIFRSRDQVDFLIQTSYDMQPASQKSKIGGYLLIRNDDSPADADPFWVGIRSYGRPKFKFKIGKSEFMKKLFKPRLRYWLDAAFVGGTVQSQSLRGFAFDVGASYMARKFQLQPYLTLGFAYGSGDSNPNRGMNGNFRQTGFQSNTGKFGGVVNFDYYGILFDPELSNLSIFTAGLGFRPLPKSSMDVVYHHYEQNTRSSSLRDIDVKGDLTGTSTNVGDEIDLIVGYREIQNFRVRLRTGYFIPGSAFVQGDSAFEGRLDVLWSF